MVGYQNALSATVHPGTEYCQVIAPQRAQYEYAPPRVRGKKDVNAYFWAAVDAITASTVRYIPSVYCLSSTTF
jgi:hypothetical protein